jgi:hypothetical protein
MGLALEYALALELVASERGLPWGAAGPAPLRFALAQGLEAAVAQVGIQPDSRYPMAELWVLPAHGTVDKGLLVQVKSGGRLGKAQRAGEAAGLSSLTSLFAARALSVVPVLCAFDAQSDGDAIQALGRFPGIQTWSGPSLCLQLGIDYDRVHEQWQSFAGDPQDNDAQLMDGFYAELVRQYGRHQAEQMWRQAITSSAPQDV